jgi:TetR/AcrR family transcriptional regulator, tetracycline repressor protein
MTETSASPGPKRPGAKPQERQSSRIVGVTRRLVEADGVEAVSMRKVAAEVGLAPTAIYWHVGSREDLLNAVLDEMVADLPPITARGTAARDRIASVARAARQEFLDQVRTLQLATELGRGNELSFRAQVALAREMSAAGLDGDDAVAALRSILFLVGGFVMIEEQYRQRPPGEVTTSELWATLDEADVDPAIQQAMTEATDTDALFAYTLDRLLDSVLA